MTTPFAAEHMAAEISRLRVELEKANEQSEHFERQWYLRGDEIEALNAKLGEQQSVPEWWKLVPVELLEELRDAANEAHNEATRPNRMKFFAALVEKADAILDATSAPAAQGGE